MSVWTIASYAAWAVSALLLGWMLFDLIRVGAVYGEDFLMSAREGEDELLHEAEEEGEGGRQ
ncbi:MAG: hypothetical protein ACPW61_06270 [Methyloligella sp. ZOD6]